MAKKQGVMEELSRAPWPVGVAAGLGFYALIRYGVPTFLLSRSSPVLHQMGLQFAQGGLGLVAAMVMAMCWVAALASWFGRKRRRRLLALQTSIESIAALSWREFELLVGEAYRQDGYAVEETGQGGADGGIDLVLRRHGSLVLVQCKQWRKRQVSVSIVREMVGLLHHHGATKVVIVGVGSFTRDAEAFAKGKPVELVTGALLLDLVRRGQPTTPGARVSLPSTPGEPGVVDIQGEMLPEVSPLCPRCRGVMVERRNRKTSEVFLGCSAFPVCRGMRSIPG